MDITATTKYVRMPASKARPIVDLVRGLAVADALKITQTSHQKAAKAIGKTLKSAIANAENNAKLSPETLRVKEAAVDEGPSSRRFWPRARGMVRPIIRRTCNIRIVLTDEAA